MAAMIDPGLISWQQLLDQTETFSQRLAQSLKQLKIATETSELLIDHACVRLHTTLRTDLLLEELSERALGTTISIAEINGRPIHILQLTKPIQLLNRQVFGLEVPFPKAHQNQQEGWEHIEFVLPTGTENSVTGVKQAFLEQFPSLAGPEQWGRYDIKVSEPVALSDQLPNPTIGLKVDGIGIKFHAYPIQKVVGFTA